MQVAACMSILHGRRVDKDVWSTPWPPTYLTGNPAELLLEVIRKVNLDVQKFSDRDTNLSPSLGFNGQLRQALVSSKPLFCSYIGLVIIPLLTSTTHSLTSYGVDLSLVISNFKITGNKHDYKKSSSAIPASPSSNRL